MSTESDPLTFVVTPGTIIGIGIGTVSFWYSFPFATGECESEVYLGCDVMGGVSRECNGMEWN